MKVKKLVLLFLLLQLTACSLSQKEFGEKDVDSGNAITRANNISELRRDFNYDAVVVYLNNDLKKYAKDNYSTYRIKNELAEIYSYQLGDLEAAIKIDTELKSFNGASLALKNSILPRVNVANNQILGAVQYLQDYIKISTPEIQNKSTERLIRNKKLLNGNKPGLARSYDLKTLEKHKKSVEKDFSKTISTGATYSTILSRLIRAEYEISNLKTIKFTANQYFLDDKFDLNNIDFSEIDFISLADYFTKSYQQTNEVIFAELALSTIYKPYSNIRSQAKRWKYNKLINTYISTLVLANYKRHNFSNMLYYASLNKSRMLLEERASFNRTGKRLTAKINELSITDSIQLNEFGLPSKADFERKVANIKGLVDFYVDGTYVTRKSINKKINYVSTLTTRDFGVESTKNEQEVYLDDTLFITYVINGKVAGAHKISGNKLDTLKGKLEDSYVQISKNRTSPPIKIFRDISAKLSGIVEPIMVADKWLSKHPLEYHLGGSYTRTVSVLMSSEHQDLSTLKLTGFFNPTLDLPGSEAEAHIISKYLPNSNLYIGTQATKRKLVNVGDTNLVHLSMHGSYNSSNPTQSKLYFYGAKKGFALGDDNALYASQMSNYNLLKDRDLIFAAACQTGLISTGKDNQAELVGMLRPLTANRNKNVILSLWKVDDKATKFFVDKFYLNLNKTHNITSAFNMARNKTKERYRSPYYWAAFYLSSFG